MGAYSVAVVGESFSNRDGGSRQAEIRLCSPGEPVSLEREPDNPHDANCVRVLSARGVQIGNIGRDDAWICERIDRGGFVDARIWKVNRGAKGMVGVVLTVRTGETDGWDPIEDDEEAPAKGCALLVGALLLSAAGLLAAPLDAQPTAVARDIASFCGKRPACVAEQRKSLRYFLNLSVVSSLSPGETERCMRSGKKGRFVDWTVAERCMRAKAKQRKAISPIFEERG